VVLIRKRDDGSTDIAPGEKRAIRREVNRILSQPHDPHDVDFLFQEPHISLALRVFNEELAKAARRKLNEQCRWKRGASS
jgi:hypothetical protein